MSSITQVLAVLNPLKFGTAPFFFRSVGAINAIKGYEETVINSNIRVRSFGGSLKQIILADASSDANGLIFSLPNELKPTSDKMQNIVVRGKNYQPSLVRIKTDGDVILVDFAGNPQDNAVDIAGVCIYS